MELYVYKVSAITRVVDGDTVDCDIDLGFKLYMNERVRLLGIDAPEVRTRDLEEKARGFEAKAWLEEKLNNAEVIYIKTDIKSDKYGRTLGEFFINDEQKSLNEQMVDEGLALIYE